ncbi:MAG: hypothetical protein OSB82_13705, partial [Alphaproteobacteria bacterium]|nr:hypothetical protein [Alphaproteobacteria bacterium]
PVRGLAGRGFGVGWFAVFQGIHDAFGSVRATEGDGVAGKLARKLGEQRVPVKLWLRLIIQIKTKAYEIQVNPETIAIRNIILYYCPPAHSPAKIRGADRCESN